MLKIFNLLGIFDLFNVTRHYFMVEKRVGKMKKEIHELIDSVRALGIELTDKPSPKCIRISGEIADFADRLRRVQVALEAVDAAGSKSVDNEAGLEGVNDPVKLRSAIDGLIRFIQVKGDYLTEADAIVRSALGLTEGQHDKSKGSLPSLTPSKMKKKRTYRPRLNIYPERPVKLALMI